MEPQQTFLPPEDDLGLLCLVVANGFTDAVLERLARHGFDDAKFAHGFIVQGLLAGDRTVKQLAERLGISAQAVSKTVQEMEALGYIDRSPDPDDGRSRVLALSERGKASLAESRNGRLELAAMIRERLGEDATQNLLDALRVVAAEFGGLEMLANRRLRPRD